MSQVGYSFHCSGKINVVNKYLSFPSKNIARWGLRNGYKTDESQHLTPRRQGYLAVIIKVKLSNVSYRLMSLIFPVKLVSCKCHRIPWTWVHHARVIVVQMYCPHKASLGHDWWNDFKYQYPSCLLLWSERFHRNIPHGELSYKSIVDKTRWNEATYDTVSHMMSNFTRYNIAYVYMFVAPSGTHPKLTYQVADNLALNPASSAPVGIKAASGH